MIRAIRQAIVAMYSCVHCGAGPFNDYQELMAHEAAARCWERK